MKMSTRLIALAAALKNAPVSFNTGDLVVHHDLFKANRDDDALLVVLDNNRQSTDPGYYLRPSLDRVENTTPSVTVGYYSPHGHEHETRVLPNYMLRLATQEEIDSLDQRARAMALDVIGDRRVNYGNAEWLTEKPPVLGVISTVEDLSGEEPFDVRAERMLDEMDIEAFTKAARKVGKDVRKLIKKGNRDDSGPVPSQVPFPDDTHTVLVYTRGVMTDGTKIEDVMVYQPGNPSWVDTEQFVELTAVKYCVHSEWECDHFRTSIDQ